MGPEGAGEDSDTSRPGGGGGGPPPGAGGGGQGADIELIIAILGAGGGADIMGAGDIAAHRNIRIQYSIRDDVLRNA